MGARSFRETNSLEDQSFCWISIFKEALSSLEPNPQESPILEGAQPFKVQYLLELNQALSLWEPNPQYSAILEVAQFFLSPIIMGAQSLRETHSF